MMTLIYLMGAAALLLSAQILWDVAHLVRWRKNRRLNSWRRWLPLGRSWRRML